MIYDIMRLTGTQLRSTKEIHNSKESSSKKLNYYFLCVLSLFYTAKYNDHQLFS